MSVDEKDVWLLNEIGFTQTQAKIYLTLLKLGETDARTLSKKTGIPKPEVYRTVKELQKKSLVEKEITTPSKFIATPMQLGLQILVKKKVQQCKNFQKKVKQFLRKHQTCPVDSPSEPEYKIILVEGRERIMQMMKLEHEDAQQSVDILTTLQRWLQILDFSFQDYMEALKRNVKYRVVIDKPLDIIQIPENIKALLSNPNFELRLSDSPLKTNGAVFDEKEVTFNFHPSKSIGESSIIWTNHVSFLSMFQNEFNNTWKSATPFEVLA